VGVKEEARIPGAPWGGESFCYRRTVVRLMPEFTEEEAALSTGGRDSAGRGRRTGGGSCASLLLRLRRRLARERGAYLQ